MDDRELASLSEDLAAIRKAIKKGNPLLRDAAAPEGFVRLSLIFALLIALFCAALQVLADVYGGLTAAPFGWKALLVAAAGVFLVAGGLAKVLVFSRSMRKKGYQVGILRIMGAFYGAPSLHIAIPASVCVLASMAFAFAVGHPWYALPAIAVFIGFFLNVIGSAADLAEYYATGYFSIAAGLASLAFVEKAPFLWLGIVLSGMLLAFAVSSIILRRLARRGGR